MAPTPPLAAQQGMVTVPGPLHLIPVAAAHPSRTWAAGLLGRLEAGGSSPFAPLSLGPLSRILLVLEGLPRGLRPSSTVKEP